MKDTLLLHQAWCRKPMVKTNIELLLKTMSMQSDRLTGCSHKRFTLCKTNGDYLESCKIIWFLDQMFGVSRQDQAHQIWTAVRPTVCPAFFPVAAATAVRGSWRWVILAASVCVHPKIFVDMFHGVLSECTCFEGKVWVCGDIHAQGMSCKDKAVMKFCLGVDSVPKRW